MEIYYCIALFIVGMTGGLVVYLFRTQNDKTIKLLLSFSGAYLFAVCVLHLIPEVYGDKNVESAGIFILAGFFLQILLEFFSKGIEHGHLHAHNNTKRTIPYTVFISLCIHEYSESIPLGAADGMMPFARHLLAGIALHKLPIAFVLMSMIIQINNSKITAIFLLILFSLMSPLGIITGSFIPSGTDLPVKITALAVGILLHVSTTILFEVSENHRFHFYKLVVILIGAALAMINF